MTVKLKTKTTTKPKSVQKFVRINIDEKLNKILNEYSDEYPLFTNAEIIKLLISKGISQNKKLSFGQILSNQEFVDIPEEDQFKWLIQNQISRKLK